LSPQVFKRRVLRILLVSMSARAVSFMRSDTQ
jgi:hypothetical protein